MITIQAKYFPLAVVDLSFRYLVEITGPIHFAPQEIRIPLVISLVKTRSDEDILAEKILDMWYDELEQQTIATIMSLPDWMLHVDSVELTRCELRLI